MSPQMTACRGGTTNVLVLGSGGREHCLAWKLAQSPNVKHVFCCPGNGGTCNTGASDAKISNCRNGEGFEELVQFCMDEQITMVVVGPEKPLCDGLKDAFASAQGIRVFGPSKAAAVLEASKKWSKDFMVKYGIPTAVFRSFKGKADLPAALAYVEEMWKRTPVVVKASGLAAGKGVSVPDSCEAAKHAVVQCLDAKVFGEAGEEIVIEERLEGMEASIFALCDGKNAVVMPAAQDHKRAFDGDKGPNTGGMGAFCPNPLVTPAVLDEVDKLIIRPTLDGMLKEGCPFVGCLFIGLILTKDGPKTLEFNVRFGDPETQAVIPLLVDDLYEVLEACTDQTLDSYIKRRGGNHRLSAGGRCGVSVVMASGGYPGKYKTNFAVHGLGHPSQGGCYVYHSGTCFDEQIRTTGGRVLTVTGVGCDIAEARNLAYSCVNHITFDHCFYRTDIAKMAA